MNLDGQMKKTSCNLCLLFELHLWLKRSYVPGVDSGGMISDLVLRLSDPAL